MLDPLRRLIDAVPRATLAEIIHEMLAAEPAKRRPGRPRKPSGPAVDRVTARGQWRRSRRSAAGALGRPATAEKRKRRRGLAGSEGALGEGGGVQTRRGGSSPRGSASTRVVVDSIGITGCRRASRPRPPPPSLRGLRRPQPGPDQLPDEETLEEAHPRVAPRRASRPELEEGYGWRLSAAGLLPLGASRGRVRPSSQLSALARGPGAERGFRPRCTTARVAALVVQITRLNPLP